MDKDNELNLEIELAETYDKLLRVSAEFENYKKRKDREVVKFKEYANENLLKELLDVVDSLEKAIEMGLEDNTHGFKYKSKSDLLLEKHHEGLKMTLENLMSVLNRFGVEQIKSKGTMFNPEYHEALAVFPATREGVTNQIIKEFNKGYLFKDRLLRPVKVLVAK